jgi:hypothetical protein
VGLKVLSNEFGSLATLTFVVHGPAAAAVSLPFGPSVSDVFFTNPIPAVVIAPISFQVVPEPASAGFCSLGLVGLAIRRRRTH